MLRCTSTQHVFVSRSAHCVPPRRRTHPSHQSLPSCVLAGVKNDESFGPLTPKAELTNSRFAMIGFAALLITEAIKGSALF